MLRRSAIYMPFLKRSRRMRTIAIKALAPSLLESRSRANAEGARPQRLSSTHHRRAPADQASPREAAYIRRIASRARVIAIWEVACGRLIFTVSSFGPMTTIAAAA